MGIASAEGASAGSVSDWKGVKIVLSLFYTLVLMISIHSVKKCSEITITLSICITSLIALKLPVTDASIEGRLYTTVVVWFTVAFRG